MGKIIKFEIYLALLRGINVGGNNIIKMLDLKQCFEDLGFNNVVTYIQSGNVIFEAPKQASDMLTKKIEQALSKQFNYKSRLVVITQAQLRQVVKQAPSGFGKDNTKYRSDVIFLKPPLTSREAIKKIPRKEEIDQVTAGKHALYFSRLISKASQSHLSRVIKLPMYQLMTIRNWNTTTKLCALMNRQELL